jgi:hypothetical protein
MNFLKPGDDALLREWDGKMTHAEMANRLGVSESAVQKRRSILGLSRPTSATQEFWNRERDRELRRLWKAGVHVTEIAKALGAAERGLDHRIGLLGLSKDDRPQPKPKTYDAFKPAIVAMDQRGEFKTFHELDTRTECKRFRAETPEGENLFCGRKRDGHPNYCPDCKTELVSVVELRQREGQRPVPVSTRGLPSKGYMRWAS